MGKVAARQRFLADHMLCPPIRYEDVRARMDIELFHLLQGDVIRSDAAYILGEPRVSNLSYVVATLPCDLVLGRRESALLLSIEPRGQHDYESQ